MLETRRHRAEVRRKVGVRDGLSGPARKLRLLACAKGDGVCAAFPGPQYGFFDDRLGPVVLCGLIMLALTTIMVVAILDYRAVKG